MEGNYNIIFFKKQEAVYVFLFAVCRLPPAVPVNILVPRKTHFTTLVFYSIRYFSGLISFIKGAR